MDKDVEMIEPETMPARTSAVSSRAAAFALVSHHAEHAEKEMFQPARLRLYSWTAGWVIEVPSRYGWGWAVWRRAGGGPG